MLSISDLILILLSGLVGGMIAKVLRQPLIIGYIMAGVVVSPNTGGLAVQSTEMISMLAEIGVALLLFSLGIEFSIRDLKPIGRIAGFGALIQVAVTLAFGYGLGRLLEWAPLPSFCLAISIVSSSTAVILKSLVTTGHTGSLSGRVMLGLSIVQDLTVIPLMIVLTSLHNSSGGSALEFMTPIFLAILFVAIMVLVGSRVIPMILRGIAHFQSQELFLFSVIAISLGIGYVSYLFGLSFAFGAFVAGLVLAGSDYGNKALSEMIPLRDLFALVFFVSVGMLLDPTFIWSNASSIGMLVFIACVGRGLILGGLCWSFGYRNVIPLAAFLGMMPISEIGFIVISQASKVPEAAVQLVDQPESPDSTPVENQVAVAEPVKSQEKPIIDDYVYSMILNMIVLSMLVGPIVSGFTAPIYKQIGRIFRKDVAKIELRETGLSGHVIIAGGRYLGRYVARVLQFLKLPYVIIEPNHRMFIRLQGEKLNALFGDPTQLTILNAAYLSKARLLLVTTDAYAEIVGITRAAQEIVPDLRIVVQYEGQDNIKQLAELGIAEVVQPEYEVGLEMLRQALISQQVSSQETEHYIEEVRQMLYSPMESDHGDRRMLRRLRRTMGLLELEWILISAGSSLLGKTPFDICSEVTVVGIMHKGIFRPNPDPMEPFKAGDCLAVVGNQTQIEAVDHLARNASTNAERT